MDDVVELFHRVGLGDAAAVRQMLRFRPELARARDAAALSVMQFARYMGEQDILDILVGAGPPLSIFEAASLDRAKDLRALLREDGSSAAYGDDGLTALHTAASFDAPGAIAALLAAGAHLEALTRDGLAMTPLHLAVARARLEPCRLLLRAGADPNARRRDGWTPLMLTAAANNRELAEMLIARNANVEWRDEKGRSAPDVAATAGHPELAARLRLGERVVDRRTV